MAKRKAGNTAPLYAGYGIGEWYGAVLRNLGAAERHARSHNPRIPPLEGKWPCPFSASFKEAAPRRKDGTANTDCTKKGGVCSLRSYFTLPRPSPGVLRSGPSSKEVPVGFGNLTCTCPVRFTQNGTVFRHIASKVLGTGNFRYVKEVGFLMRVANPNPLPEARFGVVGDVDVEAVEDEDQVAAPGADDDDEVQPAAIDDPENVGRIDTLLVDAADPRNWCAVEMQAVYFSGSSMGGDFTALRAQQAPAPGANAPPYLPVPSGLRRPDFRSSGPKRLLPQLQIKVPSLRRWGKKMVVVVDVPFFNSLSRMDDAGDISNCDIIWCIVDYLETQEGTAAPLKIRGMAYTTLESAIAGLTAGRPVTKHVFEARMAEKLD